MDIQSTLEFELRLQQYIELVREGKLNEAVIYARKHLASSFDTHTEDLHRASALLAYRPHAPGPYKDLYSPSRWTHLAKTFVNTHHTLFSIPHGPLLHVALSAGLSALKTPSCSAPRQI